MALSRSTRSRVALTFAFVLGATSPCAAATLSTQDCSASGSTLNCHLQSFLSFLYTAAGLLALVLLVVILVATRIYTRNKASLKSRRR